MRVQQQVAVATQRDLRDEYHNPDTNQLSFEGKENFELPGYLERTNNVSADMKTEFQAIPESKEPPMKRYTGTLSCLLCAKYKKRVNCEECDFIYSLYSYQVVYRRLSMQEVLREEQKRAETTLSTALSMARGN